MEFLILRPLSPKTGYHFFEGGWVGVGVGGGVGGSKVFAQKAPSSGEAYHYHTTAGRMVTQPTAKFSVGGSNPGQPTVGGGGGSIFARPGFKPPTTNILVSCTTIRPLLALRRKVSPLLGAVSATDKQPKLCVSV